MLASAIRSAANAAFFGGFATADYLAAGVAAAGAVMALMLLPAHPLTSDDAKPQRHQLVSPSAAAVRG